MKRTVIGQIVLVETKKGLTDEPKQEVRLEIGDAYLVATGNQEHEILQTMKQQVCTPSKQEYNHSLSLIP